MFCFICWKNTITINKYEKDLEKEDRTEKYIYGLCKECNNIKYEKIGWIKKLTSADLLY